LRMRSPVVLMLIILLALSLTLPGCSGSRNSEAKKPGPVIGQKPQAPGALSQFLTDLEQIIAVVDSKYKSGNKPASLVQNTKLEPEKSSEQEKTSTAQTKSKSKETGNQSKKSQSGSQSSNWSKEDQTLKNMHKNWNMLEPEAVKAGLSTSKRTQFEDRLENLTAAVAQRNPEIALEAAIELYSSYADVVEVFTSPVPPDYFRVKYEAMAATLKASQGQWTPASQHAARLREYWDHLKAQAQGADQSIISRTEFSVQDLEQAIKKQQVELVMLKSEILMNNLKNLKNEFVLRQQS